MVTKRRQRCSPPATDKQTESTKRKKRKKATTTEEHTAAVGFEKKTTMTKKNKNNNNNNNSVGKKSGRKNVFVTVGTTSFDALIEAVDSNRVVQTLVDRGYDSLTIQRGRGAYVPKHVATASKKFAVEVVETYGQMAALEHMGLES